MISNSRQFLRYRKASSICNFYMSVITDIGGRLTRLAERRHQRRALARLDRRLLNDIGLTIDVARDEIRRPFWR